MVKELCDLCNKKEPSNRFKIKMSKKGYWSYGANVNSWIDDWGKYKKICICEDCAEELFGILSRKTIINDFMNSRTKKD